MSYVPANIPHRRASYEEKEPQFLKKAKIYSVDVYVKDPIVGARER